ncbi:testisin-like [Orbicella faveolata]|uniref:testisin-like n=1 Tax=Orbicella faveolata TaxID=48498 RepID=UPI0009E53AA8|nr:testisin-like [Orbicella faveolata]
MLASNTLVATFVLCLLISFTEISQGSGNQPNSVVEGDRDISLKSILQIAQRFRQGVNPSLPNSKDHDGDDDDDFELSLGVIAAFFDYLKISQGCENQSNSVNEGDGGISLKSILQVAQLVRQGVNPCLPNSKHHHDIPLPPGVMSSVCKYINTLKLFGEHKFRNKRDGLYENPRFTSSPWLWTSPSAVEFFTFNCLSSLGKEECGTKKAGSRIVGGTDAQPGSWPWQVLLANKAFEGSVLCGGSILTSHWVVTAAHCFNNGKDPASFTLTVGEYDRSKADGTEQVIPIDQIFTHPDYKPQETGYDYDVALIKLKEPITFNDDVRPVCLPTMDFPPGTNCYVTGWGATREGGNVAQVNMTCIHHIHDKDIHSLRKILQQAQVPLVPRDTCQLAYSDLQSSITERMRCAGFSQGGVDACTGDSGGPLVCPSNNKWYLVGIVSWGFGCARPNRFGVYSDVLVLKSWVQETMNPNPSPQL